MQTYLERQGRNEYVNPASQIAYNGTNLAFVFYENQIRRLVDESPYPERRFEVLSASCVGQPREMVNLFFAPMKSLSTSQRIEKALDRLCQRYGVPSGLTSEPKIIEIRNEPKVTLNSTSLKNFNEELNTLKVFAYAHDEIDKLSGQLLLDVANRLPVLLKRRYMDYLIKIGSDLNRPKFDTLRKFVAGELNVSTFDYAKKIRVRRVASVVVPSRFAFGKWQLTQTMSIPLVDTASRGQTLLGKAELRDPKGTFTDALSEHSLLNHLLFVLPVTMRKVGIFS